MSKIPATQHWDEAVQEICGNFHTEVHRDIPFVGRIQLTNHDGLEVAHIETNARRVQHHLQAAEDSQNCFLILQTSGVMGFSSLKGQQMSLRPGEIALIDSARPFDMHPQGLVQQVSVHLPRRLLGHHQHQQQFEKLPQQGISSQMLGYMLQQLRFHKTGYQNTRQEGEALQNALITLLQPALHSTRLPSPEIGPASLRLQAEQHIRRRLADEHLSPDQIARAMGISRSTLYRLFADEESGIARYILCRRLEQCAAELQAPAQPGRSITDIAFRWGFSDVSQFSRAFRREYGLSPKAWREQHQPPLSAP
ncbi:transcriptional regulator FeaR [Parathalassolituus penaei]|uniref:Transcriptional regulator FeaR n=1 Tax=Parathalassolituus penaei TaxID=2997323 RepID=A0A9X3ITT6_9GAMM|nr:transcriptional regulator FeaR [Parathalassolituus penaei]MCY0966234.1 transcriptional regulator FeaR [Parathalassolituus penaei]